MAALSSRVARGHVRARLGDWLTLEDRCQPAVTVTNLNDSGPGSLRDALGLAGGGGTVNFQDGLTGTIALTQPLAPGTDVTVVGPGASAITLNGGQAVQVLRVNSGLTVSVSGLTLADGSGFHGGAVGIFGTLTLTDCVVSDSTANSNTNRLPGEGGGLYNAPGAHLTLVGSTVSGNSALDQNQPSNGAGGGIFNDSTLGPTGGPLPGVLALTNCTLVGNSATGAGGAIVSSGTLTLTNVTVTVNSAGTSAGGLELADPGTATLTNTLVAADTAPGAPDVGGTVTDATSNLFGVGDTFTITNDHGGNQKGTTASPLDAKLDPNGSNDNGGPTPTVALEAGSPAIDAGTLAGAPPTDQRGLPRDSHPDIGAFEVQSGLATQTALTASVNPAAPGQAVTFTATVTAASGTPAGAVTFLIDGAPGQTADLNSAGVAAFTTSSLATGSHTVVAQYSGSGQFRASQSAPVTETVLQTTATGLTATPPAPASGQPVTLTATVTPGAGAGTPTGTVTFSEAGRVLGVVQLAPAGGRQQASLSTVLDPATTSHTIRADFSGDANFAPSSGSLTVVTGSPTGSAVTAITPTTVTAGTAGLTLTVNGTGFVNGSVVTAGGTALTTTFVSDTQLRASVPANLLATEGQLQITVANPSGPASGSQALTITPAPADIVAEFPGNGVWRFEDATGWQQLTLVNASAAAAGGNGIVAAAFPGFGVWRFEDGSGWQQLATTDTAAVAIGLA